ncbi:hypothetical protein CCO02nite_26770 [Cellulomonas composti]|uniref:HNH nuclease domain-containing protein n=1 Tax=Cellulomonas composti TaxID=266130 RepID=A0A511JE01_9CELL|nr:hypothetical protein CCO02nite_26770 [Cellulomonas composti]
MPERHVDALARTLAGASQTVAAFLRSSEGQAAVVELAHGTDDRTFTRDLAALVAGYDPAPLDDERERGRRERYLVLTHTPDGTHLKGRLDPLAGQALQRALDATGHRSDEDRTHEQANADALAALAGHALGRGWSPAAQSGCGETPLAETRPDESAPAGAEPAPGARGREGAGGGDGGVVPGLVTPGVVPQVCLLVPAEAWHEVRRRRQELEAGETSVELRPHPPATTSDGTVLSPHELATALCDCAMTRVVLDGRGLPLDVGRARRHFTPAQRLAVVARDRACSWNGCGTVASCCEVHHIRWWDRHGGPSDLDNAVLLCGFHHHEVHRLDLGVERQLRAPATTSGTSVRSAMVYTFRDALGRLRNGPPGPAVQPDRDGAR